MSAQTCGTCRHLSSHRHAGDGVSTWHTPTNGGRCQSIRSRNYARLMPRADRCGVWVRDDRDRLLDEIAKLDLELGINP